MKQSQHGSFVANPSALGNISGSPSPIATANGYLYFANVLCHPTIALRYVMMRLALLIVGVVLGLTAPAHAALRSASKMADVAVIDKSDQALTDAQSAGQSTSKRSHVAEYLNIILLEREQRLHRKGQSIRTLCAAGKASDVIFETALESLIHVGAFAEVATCLPRVAQFEKFLLNKQSIPALSPRGLRILKLYLAVKSLKQTQTIPAALQTAVATFDTQDTNIYHIAQALIEIVVQAPSVDAAPLAAQLDQLFPQKNSREYFGLPVEIMLANAAAQWRQSHDLLSQASGQDQRLSMFWLEQRIPVYTALADARALSEVAVQLRVLNESYLPVFAALKDQTLTLDMRAPHQRAARVLARASLVASGIADKNVLEQLARWLDPAVIWATIENINNSGARYPSRAVYEWAQTLCPTVGGLVCAPDTPSAAKAQADSPLLNAAANALSYAQSRADLHKSAFATMVILQQKFPDNAEVQLQSGLMLLRLNRYAQAKPYLHRALELLPALSSPFIKEHSESTLLHQSLVDKYWLRYFHLGSLYERLGEYDMSEQFLRKAVVFAPQNPTTLNYLGYLLLDTDRELSEAESLIDQALSFAPEEPNIMDSKGWALYARAQYQQAIDWLERSLAGANSSAVISDHLGDAYWQVGRYRQAKFQWKIAKDLDQEGTTVNLSILDDKLALPVPSER